MWFQKLVTSTCKTYLWNIFLHQNERFVERIWQVSNQMFAFVRLNLPSNYRTTNDHFCTKASQSLVHQRVFFVFIPCSWSIEKYRKWLLGDPHIFHLGSPQQANGFVKKQRHLPATAATSQGVFQLWQSWTQDAATGSGGSRQHGARSINTRELLNQALFLCL